MEQLWMPWIFSCLTFSYLTQVRQLMQIALALYNFKGKEDFDVSWLIVFLGVKYFLIHVSTE